MLKFKVESENGTETVEAENIWEAAGQWAVDHAGFDSDDICWDPFSFSVDGRHFVAEVEKLSGPHSGTLKVSDKDEERSFDSCSSLLSQEGGAGRTPRVIRRYEMKAIRTYQDDDLRGMTILEDGRTILYRNEGGSDIVTLIPDDEGNLKEITIVDDTAAEPVNDFIQTCAETGEWGEHHDMTPEMILMYDTIKGNAYGIKRNIVARKKRYEQ